MMMNDFDERLFQIRKLDSEIFPATQAVLTFQSLQEEGKKNWWVWWERARALGALKAYKQSCHAYQKAVELAPPEKKALCWTEGGLFYVEKILDFEKARHCFEKARSLEMEKTTISVNFGLLSFREGKLDEAEKDFRQGLDQEGEAREEVYLNLGQVLRAQECYREALVCFEKAFELDPYYREAQEGVRDIERVLEAEAMRIVEWEELMDIWQKGYTAYLLESARLFARQNPLEYGGWLLQGQALWYLSRYRESQACLKRAGELASKKKKTTVYFSFSQMERRRGDYNRARSWLEKALEGASKQGRCDCLLELAHLIFIEGDWEKIDSLAREAQEIGDENQKGRAWLLRGLLARAQGHWEKGRKFFLQAEEWGIDTRDEREDLRRALEL